MIHRNTSKIDGEIFRRIIGQSRFVCVVSVCTLSLIVFGMTGLNVFASENTYEVLDSERECKSKLEYAVDINIVVDFRDDCEVSKPYVLGVTLPKLQKQIRKLDVLIETQEDLMREERRELQRLMKSAVYELGLFGVDTSITIPNRDLSLKEQLQLLNKQHEQMSIELGVIKEDFMSQVSAYKYHVLIDGADDELGLLDQMGHYGTTELVKESYSQIKNQVGLWSQIFGVYNPESPFENYLLLSPQEFVRFADETDWLQPGQAVRQVIITGDQSVDDYITNVAWERGYRPRPILSDIFFGTADGKDVDQNAGQSWLAMKQAAAQEGVGLTLNSAYRSEETQRELFNQLLNENSNSLIGRDLNPQDIQSSVGQQIVDTTLQRVAPPGYSKHHTGYTIDIGYVFGQNQRPTAFAETPGFRWLSENNYFNAKRFGFLPSYPDGAVFIGPNPESWEYVWVGDSINS